MGLADNIRLTDKKYLKRLELHLDMQEAVIEHIHKDVESIKRDIAVIKHVLLEDGNLTSEAKGRLAAARNEPRSSYKEL